MNEIKNILHNKSVIRNLVGRIAIFEGGIGNIISLG